MHLFREQWPFGFQKRCISEGCFFRGIFYKFMYRYLRRYFKNTQISFHILFEMKTQSVHRSTLRYRHNESKKQYRIQVLMRSLIKFFSFSYFSLFLKERLVFEPGVFDFIFFLYLQEPSCRFFCLLVSVKKVCRSILIQNSTSMYHTESAIHHVHGIWNVKLYLTGVT